ncbi:sodium:solute symporter family protein [Coraliomargarita sp. SDUM461004]|uniref:Sodium:solute symporter family protein n=1 Tax=Thalassobacterium sedimentorum TaxID=3041258 RepID=A0ABU1ADT9_9BACT|nr:sodium:solute symporter family protein [Coraliomargarita sp. SDUM461004]MDQ8192902.1 sodium:solute symporter family protein [Coraliomargarita sp. SDUM461004]
MFNFTLLGLPIVDIIVIIAYFTVVLWIGFRAMKRINSSEDYFLAGRKFGKGIQTFAAFGQGTSAESAVTTTTMVSTNGAAGIGMGLISGILSMPIYWMITMWYRRLRYLSLAEFFTERYGSKRMAGFYAVISTLMFMIVAAAGFTAMSKTIAAIAEKPQESLTQVELEEQSLAAEWKILKEQDFRLLSEEETARLQTLSEMRPQATFSTINRTYLTIALAIIILLYAVSGGLEAAFITDMIQGIFIIILTLMLIPFAMIKINSIFGYDGFMGTFHALHHNLPEAFFEVLGSPNLPQFTWYYILAFGLLFLINTGVQANQLTAAGSAKDDETARIGFLTGIFIKRYCSVIWGFLAMMTLLLYGSQVTDPDMVWGMATRDLLPVGLVGLMIACLMAALMSTADALMLTSSSLLTNNFYKPLFPGKSDKHYIFMGRLFCVFYIVGGLAIALVLDDVFTLFIFMLTFNSVIAACFWMGMIWRRASRVAAWVSIGVTTVFTLLLPVLLPLSPSIRNSDYLAMQTHGYDVERTYTAKEFDVQARNEEIAVWDALQLRGEATGRRPQFLELGEKFVKSDFIAPRSIFWQGGLSRNEDGHVSGSGMLKVELVLLDWLGVDLQSNSFGLNETFTAILRLIVPFGLLIGISLFTRPESKEKLDFFYARLRTPARGDHDEDARIVEQVRANPSIRDEDRLFPGTDWEFRKWTKADYIGQGYVMIGAGGVIFSLYLLVTLGS